MCWRYKSIARDTLRLLGAIEIHRNHAVYVSLNTNANPTPNPNTNPNTNPKPNPNPNPNLKWAQCIPMAPSKLQSSPIALISTEKLVQ